MFAVICEFESYCNIEYFDNFSEALGAFEKVKDSWDYDTSLCHVIDNDTKYETFALLITTKD